MPQGFHNDELNLDDWLWNRTVKIIRVPDLGECWEWKGERTKEGYGRVRYRGRKVTVSYLVLLLTDSSFDKNLFALHYCDNPPCIRPSHLFGGTQLDNIKDCYSKNRGANGSITHPEAQVRGENVWMALLTEEKVKEIRRRYETERVSQTTLAHEYGVTQTNISSIVRRLSWKHC